MVNKILFGCSDCKNEVFGLARVRIGEVRTSEGVLYSHSVRVTEYQYSYSVRVPNIISIRIRLEY